MILLDLLQYIRAMSNRADSCFFKAHGKIRWWISADELQSTPCAKTLFWCLHHYLANETLKYRQAKGKVQWCTWYVNINELKHNAYYLLLKTKLTSNILSLPNINLSNIF